jgi:hypothetical protein
MLVQLSPWETAQTSIRLPKTAKRRRPIDASKEFAFTASFVASSSRRAHQKKKRLTSQGSYSAPLLAVTSAHRITVIGRSKDPSYQESSLLQFASRPGNASSFFPMPENGNKTEMLPEIPALLDAKNDRVYAFQHGNTRICSWNSLNEGGPDEKGSVKVELRQPALSVSLLPMHKGILYGTCLDGTLFIARVVHDMEKGTESMSVEYLASNAGKQPMHAGTLAEIPSGKDKVNGRKRKVSDADGNSSVIFYQIFYEKKSLVLVRHDVLCERDSKDGLLITDSSHSFKKAYIDLGLSSSKDHVDGATLLVSSFGSSPKLAVAYSVSPDKKNGSIGSHRYCAAISLATGNLCYDPVPLPSATEQTGLVTESLVAAATKDKILMIDLQTGAVVKTVNVADLVGDSTDEWLLCTDARLAIMAVLYRKDDHVQAAFSTAHLDGNPESLSSTKLNLAAKLSSSLQEMPASTEFDVGIESTFTKNLLSVGNASDSDKLDRQMEESARAALSTFREGAAQIHSQEQTIKPHFFLKSYDDAVSFLAIDMKKCRTDSEGNLIKFNHKDAPASGKKNGCVLKESAQSNLGMNALKKQVNGVNGSNGSHTPFHAITLLESSLPQPFVDSALGIVLSVLRLGKANKKTVEKRLEMAQLDARVILRRLIETGKVSAQLHFEVSKLKSVLRSLKLSEKDGDRVFSPVDMMHALLAKCPDVSEQQMLVMLHYMLRRALPDDIVEAFREQKHLGRQHPFKRLIRLYVALSDNKKSPKKKKNATKSSSPSLEQVSNKLIMAGTSYLLAKIVSYSECNETMLRAAMLEGFLQKQEANLLASALSKILTTAPQEVILKDHLSQNTTRATCQWISSLCDAFRDELSEIIVAEGESRLASISNALASAVSQSEKMLSLQEDVKRAEIVDDELKEKSAKVIQDKDLKAKLRQLDDEIPGYSIDHMVF